MSDHRKRLKVKSVELQPSPAVLHFPAGIPPESSTQGAKFYTSAVEGYAVTQEATQWNLSYVGTSQDSSSTPCRYILGVFNKRKRALKLMPIAGDAAVRMEPRIQGLQYAASDSTTIGDSDQPQYGGNFAALNAFGGARTKKRLQKATDQEAVRHSADSNAAMESIMQDMVTKARNEGLTKKQLIESSILSHQLPPHHLEATTMEEAFVFDEICPPVHQTELGFQQILEAAHSPDAERLLLDQKESPFVLSHLPKLAAMDENEQEDYSKRLAFLSVLLRLDKIRFVVRIMTERSVEKCAHDYNMSLSVLRFLLSLFYERREKLNAVRYEMAESKSVLLQIYVIVMALMINGAEMDQENVNQLRLELKLSKTSLLHLFQKVGAKNQKSKTSGFIRLLKNRQSLGTCLPNLKLSSYAERLL